MHKKGNPAGIWYRRVLRRDSRFGIKLAGEMMIDILIKFVKKKRSRSGSPWPAKAGVHNWAVRRGIEGPGFLLAPA